MLDFRGRLSLMVLVAALVAASVVTMAVDGTRTGGRGGDLPWFTGVILDVAVPVQKVVSAPIVFAEEVWVNYIDLLHVREENAALRAHVAELGDENLQLQEALVESGRLQHIAQLRESFEIPMLTSALVGVDASPWFRSALVDRGQIHGVRAGMPLISEQGLVGLVRATSSRAARGMLLLDRQSAIDGSAQRSRTRGIVRGLGNDQLEFSFVARGHDVAVGDLIMTSGLGGVYPKGLRIGTVRELRDPGTDLMQTALIEPAVDFGRLEQVFVMLRRGPTMELLYGSQDGDLVGFESDDEPSS